MNQTDSLWNIFVVDDEPGVLRTVARVLDRDNYRVSIYGAAGDAIVAAQSSQPDLAIIDIRMPDMDGFQLMDELKRVSSTTDVILMTGSVNETDQSLAKAIRENAFYFITKPFDRDVLLALVERCLELRRLAKSNRSYLDKMRRQLASALALQKTMLPADEAVFGDYLISAKYLPCDELAGDYFDYALCDDGSISVMIADVAGHGASAAMLTSLVKSAFHCSKAEDFDPSAVVKRLSEDIAAFGADQFVTALCAKLLPKSNELVYVNSGHSGGMIVGPGETIRMLDVTCPLVSSAVPGTNPCVRSVPWESGNSLLLYTDGVTEAWSSSEMFGDNRLTNTVCKAAAEGSSVLDAIVSAVQSHIGTTTQTDDVTLLSLQSKRD